MPSPEPDVVYVVWVVDSGGRIGLFVGNTPINYIDPLGLTTFVSDHPFPGQAGTMGPYAMRIDNGLDDLKYVPYTPGTLLWPETDGITDLSVPYIMAAVPASTAKSLFNTGLSLAKLRKQPCPTALARQLGRAGEDAVGITGPKTAIEIPGSGQIRIPDALTDTTLTEVKNVESLSYSQQLRDFTTYSQANGLNFELWVRPSTQPSGPLQQAVANGQITLKFIPGAP